MSGVLISAVLFVLCIATRLPFTSRLLYNMDSVQFALGMRHFDVALHQPHPPGYFLYVMMGRAMSYVISDPNKALVAISILFAGLTVVMLYVMASEFYGRQAGIAAALIGISSPLMWFHGEVALSYMPEAFMSLAVAWLCIRTIRSGDIRYAIAASVVLGVAGGIRQNTMVFLMPLWLYSISRLGTGKTVLSGGVFCATVLAWFIPMVVETGGYQRYSAALNAHWLDSNWRGIHLYWIVFNAKYMAFFILCGLLAAAVPLIQYGLAVSLKRPGIDKDHKRALFFGLWLLPAFLFHLIIFTHPAVPGHSLIYVVGFIVLAARGLEYISERTSLQGRRRYSFTAVRAFLLGLTVTFNACFFLFTPYPLTAGNIAGHDRTLSAYIDAVRSDFSPDDTEIIGTDRFMYSYRHAMYYMPEFIVYDSEWHSTPDGPRLFWGKGRSTRMARYIEAGPKIKRFVYFINYDNSDRGSLPAGSHIKELPGGSILVYYDNIGELKGSARLAPFIDPDITRSM